MYHLLLLPCYYLFLSHVNLYGIPLLLLIVLHITTILLAKKVGMNTYSHYIGIIVTLVAFFPYIEILLHMIAAIFLLLDAASTNAKEVYDS
ncbi:hypothetical protein P9149_23665 [Bacillus thuringiensis]|uniref:hypothetical protein n=1 Tax=Bacillus thuringiensis TaxID=1428 RepID=UPI002DB8742A|nr:hypothetical protein [Bacillus thuringiensis]MEC3464860.1 hypothetical protein [Bacillus thuringiensis]